MNDKENISQIQIEISPLKESDIDQFDSILISHVRDSSTDEVIMDEVSEIKQYMRGATDEYGLRRTYLVARDQNGKVVGCMAYATPDPDMINHFNIEGRDNSIELLNVFVSTDIFRGGGIGRKLINAICAAGKSEGKKQLLIHSGPRYQKSWGFNDKVTDQECGFIENKYGTGRHAKTWKISL